MGGTPIIPPQEVEVEVEEGAEAPEAAAGAWELAAEVMQAGAGPALESEVQELARGCRRAMTHT